MATEFHPQKILIINIFGIGDVLFTTPLLTNLKTQFPNLSVGYLCNRRAQDVLKNNPCVDKIFIYERDEFHKVYQQSKFLYWKKMFELRQQIRKEQYDAVIDVSLNSFMSFLSWWAGIRRRIGLNYKNRSFLLNKKLTLKRYEGRHVVEYYLDILKELGISTEAKDLKVHWIKEDTRWCEEFFAKEGLAAKKPFIGLIPGGGASWGKEARFKHWPAESYAKLADKLFEKFGLEVILMGDSEETDLCCQVADLTRHKPRMAAGKTSLPELAALLSCCQFVILNDGGPLHIAVAAGTKTISIFGPVDEAVYGPYPADGHKVIKKNLPCQPCYRQFRRAACEHISCLNSITPEEVLKEAEKMLGERND